MVGTIGLVEHNRIPTIKEVHTRQMTELMDLVRGVLNAALRSDQGTFEWTTLGVVSPDEAQSHYKYDGITAALITGDCRDVSIEINGQIIGGVAHVNEKGTAGPPKRLAVCRN